MRFRCIHEHEPKMTRKRYKARFTHIGIANRVAFGANLVLVVLIGLLGWGIFGAPIHR